jgi:hypothetical protein
MTHCGTEINDGKVASDAEGKEQVEHCRLDTAHTITQHEAQK